MQSLRNIWTSSENPGPWMRFSRASDCCPSPNMTAIFSTCSANGLFPVNISTTVAPTLLYQPYQAELKTRAARKTYQTSDFSEAASLCFTSSGAIHQAVPVIPAPLFTCMHHHTHTHTQYKYTVAYSWHVNTTRK